jgi:hypothetical protein
VGLRRHGCGAGEVEGARTDLVVLERLCHSLLHCVEPVGREQAYSYAVRELGAPFTKHGGKEHWSGLIRSARQVAEGADMLHNEGEEGALRSARDQISFDAKRAWFQQEAVEGEQRKEVA